jgi:nucleoside-diphosphate-sugar epimerase
MAAMCGSQREKNPDHVWSEEDWNDAPGSHYSRSKTLAERKAWEYAKESGLELVTIHPSFVIGPITLARADSFSISAVLDLLNGKFKDSGIPQQTYGLVDVRDVRFVLFRAHAYSSHLTLFALRSLAHILALEVPEAAGNRYIVGSKDQYSYFEWSQVVKRLYPNYPIPDFEEKPSNPRKNGTSNEKIQKQLGLKMTPLEDTVKVMVESAVESGLAPKL